MTTAIHAGRPKTHPMRLALVCGAALIAAGALAAPAAQAQDRQYDGYCYVRSNDMDAHATTDDEGVTRSAARCMNGEYYAYTDSYRPAPRAPDGYQVEYFTHRPGRDVYSQVYNASTLTENFDPGARNHFGGNGDAYADNGGNDQYADNRPDYQPGYGYSQVQPGAIDDDRRVAGWRDDRGQWHRGQPAAIGWRDEAGHWHVGQVASYGWQDDQGEWHEEAPDNGGY